MHEGGLHGIAVVVAHQMEHPVRHQQIQLEGPWYAEATRLPCRSRRRDHDLTDHPSWRPRDLQGEGQHIRAAGYPAIRPVQPPDGVIVHDRHFHLAPRPSHRRQHTLPGAREAPAVNGNSILAILDVDRHQDNAVGSRGLVSWAS
jgi:hypothetical protein